MPSRVSVVIPSYNCAKVIGEAIDSALHQELPPHEVIVVDDASDDETPAICDRFGDKVRLVRHETNQGPAAARNTGIKEATGEFIAFLDSDDVWKSGKLGTQLAFMEKQDLAVSCTGFEISRGHDAQLKAVPRPYKTTIGLSELVWGCYISPGSTLIACTSLLRGIGGYNAAFRRYEDWDLLLRLTAFQPVGFLSDSLATVRISGAPAAETVIKGLNLMKSLHLEVLQSRNPELERCFRAGLAFERAVLGWRQRDLPGFLYNFFRSLALVPLKNQAFNIVLLGKIS